MEINWTKHARITNLTLIPSNPSRITHEIPSTGAVKEFNRGTGLWTGTLTLGVHNDPLLGQAVEAMIAGLLLPASTFRIPLLKIKNLAPSISGNAVQLANSKAGVYYMYNDRLVLSSGGLNIFPQLTIDRTAMLRPATHLHARLVGTPAMPHVPDQFGPHTLQFREVI